MARSQLYNSSNDCVDEALEGLVSLSDGRLSQPFPRIVSRSFIDKSKVALISLGGSGHEPAHAGFVGFGMLTAAVAGNVFASPPPLDILDAIIHVTGSPGCVLIVKNYTGDIVNAKIAKERAGQSGLRIEIVVCSDDCATKDAAGTGARGIAGTLFYHKILGSMAENGATLEDILGVSQALSERVRTLGLSFGTCALPGQSEPSKVLKVGTAELGLGIHGENGMKTLQVAPKSKEAAKMLLEVIFSGIQPSNIAVLINNLGGLSNLEMLVFTNDVFRTCREKGFNISFACCGPIMASLDSPGASVSVLANVTDEELSGLRAATDAFGWPMSSSRVPSNLSLGESSASSKVEGRSSTSQKKRQKLTSSPKIDAKIVRALLTAAKYMQTGSIVEKLNGLDSVAGDGDTGNTVGSTFAMFENSLSTNPPHTVTELLSLAVEVAEKMGGSLGGILSMFFGGAISFDTEETFDLAEAWRRAKESLAKSGGAKPQDRSIVDALFPALDDASSAKSAALAARAGANATSTMVAKVGRACYVPPEKYRGLNDAGAEAVALFLEAFSDHLK